MLPPRCFPFTTSLPPGAGCFVSRGVLVIPVLHLLAEWRALELCLESLIAGVRLEELSWGRAPNFDRQFRWGVKTLNKVKHLELLPGYQDSSTAKNEWLEIFLGAGQGSGGTLPSLGFLAVCRWRLNGMGWP